MVYTVERLLLQTIHVLNKVILQFLSLKSAVYNQERVMMARVRYISGCQFEDCRSWGGLGFANLKCQVVVNCNRRPVLHISTPVANSNVPNWRQFEKGWGPILSSWHPLMYIVHGCSGRVWHPVATPATIHLSLCYTHHWPIFDIMENAALIDNDELHLRLQYYWFNHLSQGHVLSFCRAIVRQCNEYFNHLIVFPP